MPLDFAPGPVKPAAWKYDPRRSQAHGLRDTLVCPFWPGATAFWNGMPVQPDSIAGDVEARVTRVGQSYGGATDDSNTDWVDYPSAVFDRSGVADLTVVVWMISGKSKSDGAGGGADSIMDTTTANNDGFRAFLSHGAASNGVRWRLPQAAGNVDISAADWTAGDLVQFVGLLGGGNQRAELWNATTGTLYSNQSNTTASITLDEGTLTVLNAVDHAFASLPGDILVAYVTIGRRWTADEILRNRLDPFGPIRPDPLRFFVKFGTAAAGGGGVSGSGTLVLQSVELNGSGKVLISGTSNLNLENLEITSSGNVLIKGQGEIVTQTLEIDASGKVLIKGTSALDLQPTIIASAGKVLIKGTGSLELQSIIIEGSATQPPVTGEGDIELQPAEIVGQGKVLISGSAELITELLQIDGSGKVLIKGVGELIAESIEINASGNIVITTGSKVNLNVTVPETSRNIRLSEVSKDIRLAA